MTKQELDTLTWVLKKMRAEALSAQPAEIEPNRKDDATTGVADEDAQALSEMMQTLASQRNKQQAELVARIDRALRKIAESPDEVGECEECGEQIASKRLLVMPYATLCAECQQARDPRRGGRRRSLTDYE